MKGTGTRRHKARASPIALIRRALFASPELRSPKSTVGHAKTKSRTRKAAADVADDEAPAVPRKAKASPPAGDENQMKSIQDVKDFSSSQMEKIKRRVDLSHYAILEDFDASHVRLQKRLKGQMQMCQEVMGEVDGEYQKVSAQMSKSKKALKATFAEFMQAAQSNSSHACKSIKDLSHSFEKNLDALRHNFGIPSSK